MSAAPDVVGLDLSITATGYSHDLTTSTYKPFGAGDLRLVSIRDAMTPIFTWADLVVIEGPVLRSSAAIALGLLHGVIRAALIDAGIPYALVPPATLKKYATGKGNAGKPEMAVALYKRCGLELADDNQVDAYWLRAMGLDHLGAPLVDLPAAQRESLTKVQWPAVAVRAVDQEDGQ